MKKSAIFVIAGVVVGVMKDFNTSASFCKSILMADKIYSLNLNFDALGCEGEISVETSPQKEQEELIENSDVNLVSKGTVLHEG